MSKRISKILALVLSVVLFFQQSGFAQVAAELDIASHLSRMASSFTQAKFRPLHLRYLAYDSRNNNFKVLLDKGDLKSLPAQELKSSTKALLSYFLTGLTLPNSSFWVNLRPDSPDNIIDEYLSKTDAGRIMLEADLQLKKDTALYTSPQTSEGREYWNKLYKKAEELYGYDSITIPTLTRPWIVPGEIIIREALGPGQPPMGTVPEAPSAYIYKATLKVMLESDYLKESSSSGRGISLAENNPYSFPDTRARALNEYSSQLIRELIIPKLTREVNSSKRYAPLRQVYYSLILAQWFKARAKAEGGVFPQSYQEALQRKAPPASAAALLALIDSCNLANLTSQEGWSKTTYFKAYQKSFAEGEYNIKEPVYTPTGQSIRSYFSGGLNFKGIASSSMMLIPAKLSVPPVKNLIEVPSVSSPLENDSFVMHKGMQLEGVGYSLNPLNGQEIIKHTLYGSKEAHSHAEMFEVRQGNNVWYALGVNHGKPEAVTATDAVFRQIRKGEENKWLFIVEGWPGQEEKEIIRAVKFAQEHDIPLEYAVVSSVHKDVTRIFLKQGLGKRAELFLNVFISLFLEGIPTIDIVEDVFYVANQIKDVSLMQEVTEELTRYLAEVVKRQEWEKLSQRNYKVHEDALRLSNLLTREKILILLNKHPDKNKIFMQMGRSHLPAVIEGYPAGHSTPVPPESVKISCERLLRDLLHIQRVVKPKLADELDLEMESRYGEELFEKFPELKEFFRGLSESKRDIFINDNLPKLRSALGEDEALWGEVFKITGISLKLHTSFLKFWMLADAISAITGKYGRQREVYLGALGVILSVKKQDVFLEDIIKSVVDIAKDGKEFLAILDRIANDIFPRMPQNLYNYPMFSRASYKARGDPKKFIEILEQYVRDNGGSIKVSPAPEKQEEPAKISLFPTLRKLVLAILVLSGTLTGMSPSCATGTKSGAPLGIAPEGQIIATNTSQVDDLLDKVLKSPEAIDRISAAYSLEDLENPKILDTLIKALDNPNINIRGNAVYALGVLKDPGAVRPLLKALAKPGNIPIRIPIVYALGELRDPMAFNVLYKLLLDQDDAVRHEAASALIKINDPRAIRVLSRDLRSLYVEIRKQAVDILSKLKNPGVFVPLFNALFDPDPIVNLKAVDALRELEDTRSLDDLMKALVDPAKNVRMRAIVSLGNSRDPKTSDILLKFLASPDADERMAAVVAFEDLNALDDLIKVMADPDADVRMTAAIVLGEFSAVLDEQHPYARLFSCFSDRIYDIKAEAFSPYNLFLIYGNKQFRKQTDSLDKIHQFSLARGIENILTRYNKDVNDRNIEIVFPFVLEAWENQGKRLVINKDSRIIAGFHNEPRFAPAEFAEFMRNQFGINTEDPNVFLCAKGSGDAAELSKAKETLLQAIEDPRYSVFYFDGHGSTMHLLLYEKNCPEKGNLHAPYTLSYEELAQALYKRSKENKGKLSDLTMIISSCYSADFAVNTLNKLAILLGDNRINGLPAIITTTNRGTLSYQSLGGIKKFSQGKDELRWSDFYQIELSEWTRQQMAFFLFISPEKLGKLEEALNVKDTDTSAGGKYVKKEQVETKSILPLGLSHDPEEGEILPLSQGIPMLNVRVTSPLTAASSAIQQSAILTPEAKESASSTATQMPRQDFIDASPPLSSAPRQNPGGIDLRFLPIITQAMSNLQVSLHQGALSTKELLGINLIQEWQDIQKMVEAGIIPSTDRL
ncbi:MAG: HEAT repeat domain-containing protein, partial [Candidatus Omnitrophota bacterium]